MSPGVLLSHHFSLCSLLYSQRPRNNGKFKDITLSYMTSSIGTRPCGPTDKASDYGSEDSRFKSWQGRFFLSCTIYRFLFFARLANQVYLQILLLRPQYLTQHQQDSLYTVVMDGNQVGPVL